MVGGLEREHLFEGTIFLLRQRECYLTVAEKKTAIPLSEDCDWFDTPTLLFPVCAYRTKKNKKKTQQMSSARELICRISLGIFFFLIRELSASKMIFFFFTPGQV